MDEPCNACVLNAWAECYTQADRIRWAMTVCQVKNHKKFYLLFIRRNAFSHRMSIFGLTNSETMPGKRFYTIIQYFLFLGVKAQYTVMSHLNATTEGPHHFYLDYQVSLNQSKWVALRWSITVSHMGLSYKNSDHFTIRRVTIFGRQIFLLIDSCYCREIASQVNGISICKNCIPYQSTKSMEK